MEKQSLELSVRSLSNSLSAFNVRVGKLSRMQEKVQSKEGMLTLRNALKLYQNYKAMGACCESVLHSLRTVEERVHFNGLGHAAGKNNLVIGRVANEYLLLARDGDRFVDFFPDTSASHPKTYAADEVVLFSMIPTNDGDLMEHRVKQPVLALYPNTNKMLPGQVSSTPTRRRKTGDYLIKFPTNPQSVPCSARFVCSLT